MSNEEQIAYWNGDAGKKWADLDAQMSRLLAPIAEMLMDHAQVDGARRALDVGCGGGSESFALLRRLGGDARVLGVDISEPMLAVAEAHRAEQDLDNVTFLHADASTHDFGDQTFDLLFSRFGVMFFDDPSAAFGHLRGAMTPGARLAFTCWQPLPANPWVAVALQAALTVLPPPAPPPPRSPGPFAFGEADYITDVLQTAGWSDINVQAQNVDMRWPDSGGYSHTVRELVKMGPVGRLLADVDDATREAVYVAVEGALGDYYNGECLSLPGAIWMVTATNEA